MRISDLFAKKHLLFLSASLFAFQLNVRADDDAPTIQIHGFSTLGYSRILQEQSPNSLGYGIINKSGTTLYNSLLGLNLSYVINEQVTFYGQLTGTGSNFVTGGLDTVPYALKIDMAMLNYHPFDWVDIRVGRQIMPLWMESEQIDVGVSYPWIRPPMEVYNLAPIKAANGIGIDLKCNFFDSLDVLVGARYGDGSIIVPGYVPPPLLSRIFLGYTELKYNNMLKLRASYGATDGIATSTASPEMYLDGATSPSTLGATTGSVNFDILYTFSAFGGSFDWNNILLMGEYAVMNQKINSANAVGTNVVYAGPSKGSLLNRAWYATAAYHFGDWTPHFTYSRATKSVQSLNYDNINNANFTVSNPFGVAALTAFGQVYKGAYIAASIDALAQPVVDQHTITWGLNYNFTPTIVGKAQWEQTRTNNAPAVNFVNSPQLASNDIINIGELALSFVF